VTGPSYDVVVPTVGRASLGDLLGALGRLEGVRPGTVWVVADRPGLGVDNSEATGLPLRVLPGGGRGPAAARNAGWRSSRADWIVFLDDDVLPDPDWAVRLAEDLSAAKSAVGGVQGRIVVPLPQDRRATDWERNVSGLEGARWATADMAYRRAVLREVDGFDERFPRAYREDADLALRVMEAGYRLVVGTRRIRHPVRSVGWTTPIRLQAGNADDVLMRALHGPGWRRRAGAPAGRLPLHVAATALAAVGMAGLARRRRLPAVAGAAGWATLTTAFARERIAPGPRTPLEVARVVATSIAIPPVATTHWLRGWLQLRRRLRTPATTEAGAVLLDRDGTLVTDIPYNGDPDRVRPVPGARRAVARLRAAGLKLAVVSNQSGVGRGLLSPEEVEAVNQRVERLLGPLGPWFVCPHAPVDDCGCRKPAPGLIVDAARRLGVPVARCVVIGDTGADVQAASAAGARAILVPNGVTRPEEVDAAPEVARNLEEAVDRVLGVVS
jgi:histidinol-phosphate phosphatase family protein